MADITLAEVKQEFENLQKAVLEQRKAIDAKLDAVKHERSGAEFDEKVDRLNEVISKADKAQRDWQRQKEADEAKAAAAQAEWRVQQDEHTRKMEARLNRIALGLGGSEGDANPSEKVQRKAFETGLRHGKSALSPEEIKVLTVANDTTGGYLAPPTYEAEIIKAEVLYSPMRGLVTVRTVGTGNYQQPRRTSTAAATRVGEIATRSESTNPAWGLVQIDAPEMYAEARISWANLEDSAFDLAAVLRDEFAEQFGVTEGKEVISGTGKNACQGIIDASAGVAYTASGAASTIASVADGSAGQANGLVSLFHAVKTAYARNGTWVLNRASLGKVRSLKDTTGAYLWQPGVQAGNPGSILGAPYVECPDMSDEGSNAYPIAFGDFRRAYTMVERVGMMVTRDDVTLAPNGQVKFFARRRVGGQVVLAEAIRLLKCATS